MEEKVKFSNSCWTITIMQRSNIEQHKTTFHFNATLIHLTINPSIHWITLSNNARKKHKLKIPKFSNQRAILFEKILFFSFSLLITKWSLYFLFSNICLRKILIIFVYKTNKTNILFSKIWNRLTLVV